MKTPRARGPVGACLAELLCLVPGNAALLLDRTHLAAIDGVAATNDILHDDDLQVALFTLNALHYGGFEDVSDSWEWNPRLIAIRSLLEDAFEAALRTKVTQPECLVALGRDAVANTLFALVAKDSGRGLSRFIASKASKGQLIEFLISRSIYTLREADPHSWAIPRLTGAAKVGLMEIQFDEYGGGRPDRMHSALFAATVRGMGLDDAYGAYVDQVPAIILASVNMMSLFGLHRRLRGAIVGHLAAFEMTSSTPNRMYGNGLRRLGFGDLTEYFDEHIEADAVHEQIAARDLAGGLVEAEPDTLVEVLFGAAACLAMDGWVAEELLSRWESGESSLRRHESVSL